MSTTYERFVTMAEKKHACPLCSRGFDPAMEAQFTAKVRKPLGEGHYILHVDFYRAYHS